MELTYLKSKLHRATITEANLEYEGSLSIDPKLMEAAKILPFERIEIYNIGNGERLATYAIEGKAGEICLNGAAAWKGKVGQKVIICTYVSLTPHEASTFKPQIVLLKGANQIDSIVEGHF